MNPDAQEDRDLQKSGGGRRKEERGRERERREIKKREREREAEYTFKGINFIESCFIVL